MALPDALSTQAEAQQSNATGPVLGGGLLRQQMQPVRQPAAPAPAPTGLPPQGRQRPMPSPQHLAIAQHLTNAYRGAFAPPKAPRGLVTPTTPTLSVPTAPR